MSAADDRYMRMAVAEAEAAARRGEAPVGCVVVSPEGEVVGRGHNLRETACDPTAHAEVVALRRAGARLGRWRLEGCTAYVTVEPCSMCMGAMVLARLRRLVFGCRDPKAGAAVSVFRIGVDGRLNHRLEVTEGVLEDECRRVMKGFFEDLRQGGGRTTSRPG